MLSIAILFAVWMFSSTRQAILAGLFFGLALFGVGVSWMYISLNTYGGMPPAVAGFSIFLGIITISCYPMICGWLQSFFIGWNINLRLCLIMPSLWIIIEWLRGWLFTGFPWLSAGYAYLDTPLSNFAPIGGVYLVGYLALLSAGALVAILRNASVWNSLMAVFLIGFWIVGWQLNETAWTRAEGELIDVAVVQNNVPLNEKWAQDKINATIEGYLERSRTLQDQDLVVWPEAAIPEYLDNLSNEFWREIETHPADFIFGVLHRDQVEGSQKDYNSVVAVTDQIMIYRKQHLVPFGEYFPLQWLFRPLLRMLDIPMSEFTPWKSPQRPLIAADNAFAISICFEDAFPGDIRSQVENSGVLVNVSEDSWFGDSFAPHQRLQMARFRSRESERPMIRSSNNGLSSLINWKGGLDVYAPQFVQYVVKGQVQPRTGTTPYITFGDSPIISVVGFFLVIGVIFGGAKRRRGNSRL